MRKYPIISESVQKQKKDINLIVRIEELINTTSPMFTHSPLNKMASTPASSLIANSKSSTSSSTQRVEFSRRIVLPLLIAVAAVPDASESQKALFQGKPCA
jgi:hypothetical protein